MIDVIIISVLMGILSTFLFLAIINKHLSSQWFCDKMGWHLAPVAQSFDGCSFGGTCPRCHEKVLQDGQGNWF